jgi:predicted nuclease of restriction endonuclease-like (RecB) superfamily
MKNPKINYISQIKKILIDARKKSYIAINNSMIEAYWLIGKKIVEEEQNGNDRANYGEELLKNLSRELSKEFGKGFSITNLQNFRKFYVIYNDWQIDSNSENSEFPIQQTLSAKLSWSHYERLIRVENKEARAYYLTNSIEQNWSVRTLDRNISTLYYHRLISSQLEEIKQNKTRHDDEFSYHDKNDFIKNPTVLDFLNIPSGKNYTENELEQNLIDNIQQFLLELGKGFSFVARQKHIKTETTDFFIDLVFYNYILKCFVLIELKTHKISHQDIGQLDMYVRMFDDLEISKDDNPTIGILLCTQTDSVIAKYSVLKENKQLFATKYLPFLPTEEELIAEIEREKLIIKQKHGK